MTQAWVGANDLAIEGVWNWINGQEWNTETETETESNNSNDAPQFVYYRGYGDSASSDNCGSLLVEELDTTNVGNETLTVQFNDRDCLEEFAFFCDNNWEQYIINLLEEESFSDVPSCIQQIMLPFIEIIDFQATALYNNNNNGGNSTNVTGTGTDASTALSDGDCLMGRAAIMEVEPLFSNSFGCQYSVNHTNSPIYTVQYNLYQLLSSLDGNGNGNSNEWTEMWSDEVQVLSQSLQDITSLTCNNG